MNEETKESQQEDSPTNEGQEKTATAGETTEGTEEQEATDETVVEEAAVDFEAKYNEVNDKFLRLYSEFENFRRRTAKEKIDILTNAKGESLKSMLPVVDDFDRAIINNENTEDKALLKDGFQLIHQKFMSVMLQNGLQPMASEKGDDFDTDKHEAITQIPAPSPELKGKVVDIIEKGYVTNGKVIRYAKVVIGS